MFKKLVLKRLFAFFYCPFVCLAFSLILTAQTLNAQDSNIRNEQIGATNFAYACQYGNGQYSAEDQLTYVLRVTPTIGLRSLEENSWGLLVRLGFVFGLRDFNSLEDFDLDQTRIYTLSPGVELLIPIGKLSTLRPYLNIGYGLEAESKKQGVFGSAGIRAEFLSLPGKWRTAIEPGVHFNGSRSAGDEKTNTGFIDFRLLVTARYPIGYPVLDAMPDDGVYAQTSAFLNPVEFEGIGGNVSSINAIYSIGIVFGFQYPRPSTILGKIPSVSVGYQFGQDFSGWTVRFGGDPVTPVRYFSNSPTYDIDEKSRS